MAVLVIQRPAVAKVFIFEVADKYEYFHKQAKFGLHMPLVFGDHIEDVKMLGEVLGMEVVTA